MRTHFQHILALDTSTARASVALCSNHVWYEENIETTSLHAQSLLPMIEHLFSQAGLTPQQLDAIAFGRGPGSFTGLRIACSVAKGLAYAHDIPLYPVSSLAAIARQVFEQEGSRVPVLAAIDARMNQLYWGYYAECKEINVPEHVTAAEDIMLSSDTPFMLAGVGFEAYEQLMPDALSAKVYKRFEMYPSARTLISIVETTTLAPVDVMHAAPVYVRNQVTHGEVRG